MTPKIQVLVTIIVTVVGFAVGRYSIKPQDQTSKSTNTVQQNTHETIVRVKEPGGKTTTTVTIDKNLHAEDVKETAKASQPRLKFNVSGLVGTDIHTLMPVYGVSVNKELLGPITIGVYGLTTGMVGLSIGVNF